MAILNKIALLQPATRNELANDFQESPRECIASFGNMTKTIPDVAYKKKNGGVFYILIL